MTTTMKTSYEQAVNNIDYLPQNNKKELASNLATTNFNVQNILDGNSGIDQNEVLGNKNNFREFVKEQSLATDIARLGGLKPGALLKEQLTALGLYQKQKPVNNESYKENSIFGAPNKTVQLGGLVA